MIDLVGFTVANAVAASQLAELGVTPGSGTSPNQPLHELHTASQQTNNPHSVGNAAAPSQLAELGATPGSGASPNQLLHELHTTPQQTSNPHSPSITLTALGPSNQPVLANAAHTQILDEPGTEIHSISRTLLPFTLSWSSWR
jgi:hypothetical protein